MAKLEMLDPEESAALIDGTSDNQKRHSPKWREETSPRRCSALVHLFILYATICLLLVVVYLERTSSDDPGLQMYSPLNHLVEYEDGITRMRKGLDGDGGPYIGRPDDALDELWKNLYHVVQSIHIPRSEAMRLYDPTVPIWNMTGEYMIGVEVFHQLHCLDMLRKAAWPERYHQPFIFANGTRNDFFTRHFEHCVENLRMAIMCHSDVTPVTFHWQQSKQLVAQKLETPHKCRNFGKIRRWAGERSVAFDDRHYPFVWVKEPEERWAVVP